MELYDIDYSNLTNDELESLYVELDSKCQELSFQKFIDYNNVDNLLVEQLNEKKRFLELGCTVASFTKSKLSDCLGTVKIWDNLIYHMGLSQNEIIPPKKESEHRDFGGGYVKEPIPGEYLWPVSFDLTSLYPMIVIMLNLSPESIVSKPIGGVEVVDKLLSKEVVPTDYLDYESKSFAANGATFRTDIDAILPKAMQYVFDERARYKNMMKDAKNKAERAKEAGEPFDEYMKQVQMYDMYQKGVKVVANGGYGAIGNVAFRYYNPDISEAITLTGQYVIRWISDRINEFLNKRLGTVGEDYVVGNDTDSALVTLAKFVEKVDPEGVIPKSKIVDIVNRFCEDEIEVMLEKQFVVFSRYLQAKKNTMNMKREAICDKMLYRGKKNYIMRVWDMEHVRYAEPEWKIAGIETQRSDKPKVVREKMKSLFGILFDGTETDIQKEVSDYKKAFFKMPLNDISFPKGVSNVLKYTGKDGSPCKPEGTNAIPIFSRAAVVYNHMLSKHPECNGLYTDIRDGDKIKWVYLKVPNHSQHDVIGWNETLPKEFDLERYVDKEKQFEKIFLSPMQSLARLKGWNCVKVESLDDLFV